MAEKPYWRDRIFIWVTNTCLLQGGEHTLVSMVKVTIKIPFRMGGSWSDSEDETPKVVINSSITTNNNELKDNNEPTLNVEGSFQYYQRQAHLHK
jgi:hypothetical protein